MGRGGARLSRGAALARLQEVDTHAGALTADIAALQALLRRDPELERQRARRREEEEALQRSAESLAGAEEELAALEKRARQLDRRLYDGSVRNPAELLEMQRELGLLRAQRMASENRALELMEANDAAVERAAAAQAVVADLEARRDAESEPRRRRLKELQRALAETVSAREAVVAEIPAADLALYTRVGSRRQPAVAGIKGDACGGCHLPLSNEERRAVRAGESIVQCSNCDRILVP